MNDFESKRRAIFERVARQSREQIDTASGLMPAPGPKTNGSPLGAHGRASVYEIRATTFAATALAMTGSRDLAWKAVSAVLDHQDRDPRSFTYGNFLWWTDWKFALDPNAVSFIVPHLCYILRHCEQRMPAELVKRLKESLQLCVTGLNAHRATWGYTNIALLNMASKLMIGDVLGDPRAMKLAYWDWEEWRNHTVRLGTITEYNSVGYTTVQIDAFALMLTCKAEPQFLREVRGAMRHLIAASIMDYHPGVGRITGPQSRAYAPCRRLRGVSGMDMVLWFVLNTPEPEDGCILWLGVPLGPEDVLECARNLPLPRVTRCATHGCSRFNYLGQDFALGHVSGRGHWICNQVPFFLAYRSRARRCGIPFMPYPHDAEGHFAAQREGRLLAATLWLIDRTGTKESVQDRSFLSGLRTGRPDNLIEDPEIFPGYDVELGMRPQIRILDGQGQEVPSGSRPLTGTALVVETESIYVGIRFFDSGTAEPALEIGEEPDSEIILKVRSPREGWVLNELEEACFCAFFLEVLPRSEVKSAAEMARRMTKLKIDVTRQDAEWRMGVGGKTTALNLSMGVEPARMYSMNDTAVSPNQWARGLNPS